MTFPSHISIPCREDNDNEFFSSNTMQGLWLRPGGCAIVGTLVVVVVVHASVAVVGLSTLLCSPPISIEGHSIGSRRREYWRGEMNVELLEGAS